jgi:hypothetical protein
MMSIQPCPPKKKILETKMTQGILSVAMEIALNDSFYTRVHVQETWGS